VSVGFWLIGLLFLKVHVQRVYIRKNLGKMRIKEEIMKELGFE
jgi:hypothetical protein